MFKSRVSRLALQGAKDGDAADDHSENKRNDVRRNPSPASLKDVGLLLRQLKQNLFNSRKALVNVLGSHGQKSGVRSQESEVES
jgi:hypothetical protein